jgi:hypothetical protein
LAIVARRPRARSHFVLIAVRPKATSAWTMMAMMTALIPYSAPPAAGSFPKRTYVHAIAVTISAAGRMKQSPARSSPRHPARRYPR